MDVRKAEVLRANPACARCEHLTQCRTGCRVSAVLAGNGLLGRDDITCNIFRKACAHNAKENAMSQYYILNSDWQLRGFRKDVRLCLNWKSGERRFLNPSEFVCAQMCDGKTDFDSPVILPVLRRLVAQLQSEGIVRPCACGESLLSGQAYRQAPNSYIDSLLLSITNRCNFRCRHCFVEAWKDKYGEFSREQLMCLVDQFEQANVADIALTGGEPLMSPYFKEFVRYLAAKRIGFTEIFTNAALIDDEVLDVIAEAGFRPYFKVSFDCSGSHDYMRGVVGAEESTLRGIRLLRKRGFSVTVITSIDKVVIGGLIDTLHLLASLGVDNWWMAPPMEIGAWRGTDSGVDMKSPVARIEGRARRMAQVRTARLT